MNGELPVRILERPEGGTVIACLCGAESAVLRKGLANTLTRLRESSSRPQAGTDLTTAGLLRMVLHAKTCQAGRNLLDEERQASRVRRENGDHDAA